MNLNSLKAKLRLYDPNKLCCLILLSVDVPTPIFINLVKEY
jgi:hypothetical protein